MAKEYSNNHEWYELVDGIACVGITNEAVKEIGEIVYVELPKLEKRIEKGQDVSVIESTKAAVDIQSPISGTIVAVNSALATNIMLINKEPEQGGWLFKVRV